jgi:ATP-dependent exoDNAse (exonuclease V) beta subunit|tara:strand:+ start:4377 stop:5192 length:816 start_codon:yes stop_codon:yes gene_type:complete
MAIIFKEEGHVYESSDQDKINWTSVTSFIGKFKPKFDAKGQAKKSAKNKRSKWYGMTEKEILLAWSNETDRAIGLGNWYHNQRESDMLDLKTIGRHGVEVPIIKPIINDDGIKIAPVQKIEEGVYPEHLVYLKSVGLCGQADLVEVVNGYINITDYKTNKEIKEKGFTNWEGITSKLYNPVNHLDDCNLNHYNLQLSIYAYIIKKHNPKLKIGDLVVQHVKFKQVGTDKNGYPINERVNGEPVIQEVKMYKLPYLKDEVRNLIMWFKDNKK